VTRSKGEDVTRHWRKEHNEEPYDSHSSQDNVRDIKFKGMRKTERVARGERRGAYRVLVRRPEENKLLGTPRRRWEYNIKMDLQGARSGALSG
jgi:hypothetical protein